jgi:hypothetical protein
MLMWCCSTIKVFYSKGMAPLKAVTDALPNANGGGGQLQIGIAKKPTETQTVVLMVIKSRYQCVVKVRFTVAYLWRRVMEDV